ncbi:MAG: hypothetical protein LBJ87_09965 [bacterium]|nr:hypothetical protein [bacterium]
MFRSAEHELMLGEVFEGEKDVFVLGAGFSRAISPSMPLLSDLAQALMEPAEFLAFGGSLERWLSFLAEDHPWLTPAENARQHAMFLQQSSRLAAQVRAAQASAVAEGLPTWLAQLIDLWHRGRSTVLSFNYDVLVERAWTKILGAGADGAPAAVYPIPPAPLRTRRGVTDREGPGPATLQLLKLHGSLNWLYSGPAGTQSETVYDASSGTGWAFGPEDQEDHVALLAPDKVPFVVPPTRSKTAFFDHELIRAQWQMAREAVASAERIFFLGHSLPESGGMLRSLLRASARGKVLVPIDTNQAVVERYRSLRSHEVVDEYVLDTEPIPSFVRYCAG